MLKKLYFVFLCSLILRAHALTNDVYDSLKNVGAPYPYSCRSKAGQLLEIIGTCHTNDRSHSQYSTIDTRWKAFLQQTNNKPITIIEAAFPVHYNSRESALQQANDCGYANWLSSHNNVPVVPGELTHAQVARQLISEFGKDKGYYFAFAQAMDFSTRGNDFSESSVLSMVQSWTGDSSITFDQLKKLHFDFTGSTFSPSATFFFNLMNIAHHNSMLRSLLFTFSVPRSVLAKFYPILRRSHQIRDQHLLQVITSQWHQGKNIFIVYGYMHAAALKKSLKSLARAS